MTRSHRAKTLLLALLVLASVAWPATASDSLVVTGRLMNLHVDVDHCAGISTLCSGSGSIGAAAAGNDSIVVLTIYLRGPAGGVITGVAESSFSIDTITSPSGNNVVFVGSGTCPACFAEPSPGVYRLAARSANGALWSGGTYTMVVDISAGGSGTAELVSLDIPF